VPDDDLERLRALFEHVHELENNMSPFRKVMWRMGFSRSVEQPKPFPMTKPETDKDAA
jgi:hypothetical protein